MFDHKNFALNGLFPGLVTTRSIANLGAFEIEVIITPVQPSFGGGGFGVPISSSFNKYKVKIRITRNGKTWEYERVVGSTMAKVVASITNIKIAEPTFFVTTKLNEQIEPSIKVTVNTKGKT